MKSKSSLHHGHGVEQFLAQHGGDVTGVIEGFDRLRLRGSLRDLLPAQLHVPPPLQRRRAP